MVMTPLLFRPLLDKLRQVNFFCGSDLVISMKRETARLRVPGVYALKNHIAILILPLFDR
jgi:hypothetical protein